MKRSWSLAFLFALALPALSAFAKPLYVTVPRSFSSDERPLIEVAFSGKEPVELRVLQPLSTDAFVRAQADLRRAYEPPALRLNLRWFSDSDQYTTGTH